MVLRIVGMLLALSLSAAAGVITDVRGALARNDFNAATGIPASYRAQHGVDPEYLEALSWMGRGVSSQIRFRTATVAPAWNGGRPVHMKCRTVPRLNRSER